jgi:hypothetical protein
MIQAPGLLKNSKCFSETKFIGKEDMNLTTLCYAAKVYNKRSLKAVLLNKMIHFKCDRIYKNSLYELCHTLSHHLRP